jgi:hypothetical protein
MKTNSLTKSTSSKMGQPTKYRHEYCEQLEKHMGLGYSFEAFASKLDVDRQTLYNWCVMHPEFKEAKDKGTEKSRYRLERNLMRTARTGKGNVIASLFMLKNRFPNEWRDRKEVELQKNDENKSNNLSLDEQLAKVEAMRAHLMQLKGSQTQSEALTIEANPEPHN